MRIENIWKNNRRPSNFPFVPTRKSERPTPTGSIQNSNPAYLESKGIQRFFTRGGTRLAPSTIGPHLSRIGPQNRYSTKNETCSASCGEADANPVPNVAVVENFRKNYWSFEIHRNSPKCWLGLFWWRAWRSLDWIDFHVRWYAITLPLILSPWQFIIWIGRSLAERTSILGTWVGNGSSMSWKRSQYP